MATSNDKILERYERFARNPAKASIEEFETLHDKIETIENEVAVIKETVNTAVLDIKEELKKKLESELVLEIDKEELRGEKGDDYVLTHQDKKDIAELNHRLIEEKIAKVKNLIPDLKPLNKEIEDMAEDFDASINSLNVRLRNLLKAIPTDYLTSENATAIIEKAKDDMKSYVDSRPKTEVTSRPVFGGRVGMQVYNNGTKVGTKVNEIDFRTNLTVAQPASGLITVSASGGGSLLSTVDVSGDLNGSNTAFTLPEEPSNGVLFIVLGQSILWEGVSFTRTGVNLTYLYAPSDDMAGLPHKAILF